MNFSVSVVIPVFNAEKFIEKSIISALHQIEVTEVIVVNDGSTDNTLNIIKNLQLKDTRIKIYHHQNNKNRGRSSSRNLGLKNTTNDYIAFLDADDFYLKNRFKNDKIIFQEDSNVDGVYNAIGVHYYRELEVGEKERLKLTTIKNRLKPEALFEKLLSGNEGHFSIDGLTVKKSVFDTVGYFNETLLVAEDTDLLFKMALKCKLMPGIIDSAVAIRGVHKNNVSNNDKLYDLYRVKMFESLLFWSSKQRTSLKKIEKFLEWLWVKRDSQKNSILKDLNYWLFLTFKSPKILFTYLTVKYFPLVRHRKKLFSYLYI